MKRSDFIKTLFGVGFLLAVAPHIAISNPELFDPDYKNVYDAMYEKPPHEIAMAQNQWVIDIKKCGAWDKFNSIYFPANNQHDSFINWKGN